MATSTVARNMANFISIVLFLAATALASTGSVSPSNSTLPKSESASETQLKLVGDPTFGDSTFNIAPLTVDAGLGQSLTAVAAIAVNGSIMLTDPFSVTNLTTSDIAIISCDPNENVSNIDPSSVVETAGNIKPQAIVLYSLAAQECNLTSPYNYTSIYSMTSLSDSRQLMNTLQLYPSSANTLKGVISTSTNTTSGQGSSPTSNNNDGGPAPTTAVAMSILYSITGIITLLFLVIIATGAIRAHRHPERYGPRTGFPGRPRQSRAKGLARAMLETLPIVKFGDPEPVKPGSRDIELEDGNTSVHASPEVVPAQESGTTEQSTSGQTSEALESGMGPAQAESIKSRQEPTPTPGELGCSICTEDFTTGEDVRVLPCQHKYHPACIDPWLLNVSGTCPLCRHDLRPITSGTSDTAGTAGTTTEGDELPPPLAAEGTENGAEGAEATEEASNSNSQRRTRISRLLDPTRLRHAPPDERIAALRRLREQSQSEGELAEDVEEPSRRARLTGRLRDTFRIRTRTEVADTNRQYLRN